MRTAATTAETVAIDNGGSYASVSLAKLHRYEETIPVSRREAERGHDAAYLFLAKGTENEYVVGVVALGTGGGYLLDRTREGELVQTSRVCGKTGEW